MALNYNPSPGEVLRCDFGGFRQPEMVKARWVVVISPRALRYSLETIVPLSTTPPKPVASHHHKLTCTLPHNEGDGIDVWAKCDMVYALAHSRLSPWWKEKSPEGKRVYIPITVSPDDLAAIRSCVLRSIGL